MEKIDFNFTQDGSVGMYDGITKDIFHSVTGAKKESFDKFIYSTGFEKFCEENNTANVLDICFGIGYNTKAAIYFALKNNPKIKLKITALEISKEVAFLSPFIIDGYETPEINLYLLAHFLQNYDDFIEYIVDYFRKEPDIKKNYFCPNICLVFESYINKGYSCKGPKGVLELLHNIYYQNISDSMKVGLKANVSANIYFKILFDDGRVSAQNIKSGYNFVFLDAFTPHKQPLLWSYEFLSLLKSKMDEHGILSTYSNSTPVRKTLFDLGFNLGKIILDNSQFGTVASLDKSKIQHELTEYDYGLMNTKAGIAYRDKNLSDDSATILKNREEEVSKCDIMSASEYKRIYGKI